MARRQHRRQTLAIEDPATGETLCDIANGTPEDAVAALDAACAVQDDWAATAPRERGEILRRAFELMTERADDLGAADDAGDGQAARRVLG